MPSAFARTWSSRFVVCVEASSVTDDVSAIERCKNAGLVLGRFEGTVGLHSLCQLTQASVCFSVERCGESYKARPAEI